jgi:indolepyruvate ferredoxin oxidoreductase beta subunit
LLATDWARRTVARFASKGRVVQTSSIRGFLLLYMVASMRRFRRSSLRFADEHARIATWLTLVAETAQRDLELAIAAAECQRLVKGYGDTHVRGTTNYTTLIAQVPVLVGRAGAANVLRQLRDAALADEHGTKLAAAIAALATAATA